MKQTRADLDDKYQQYSLRLEDLRDHELSNPSQVTLGVESGMSEMSRAPGQSGNLKEHLIRLITSNRENPDIDEASVESLSASESDDESLLEGPRATRLRFTCPNCLTTANKRPEQDVKTALLSSEKLEEEGHFVPERGTSKRLENRLLLEDPQRTRFFDATGELRNDAPLLRRIPPPMRKKKTIQAPGETENVDESMFVPASVWGVENASTARHIRVEVREIRFISHPLSSDQEVLAYKLRQLVEGYLRDLEFSRTHYFVDRIRALRKELKKGTEDEKKLLTEIVECHRMRDQEEERMVTKREAIVETWHVLRDLRTKGKVTTPISLKWHSKKYTEEEKQVESEQFEKTIARRAREICRLRKLETGEEPEVRRVISDLKSEHSELGLRQPGETQWVPVLVETPVDGDDELCASERERFAKLARARLYVSFMMGTTELRSDDVPVERNFTAAPNIGCHAVTMHVPTGVKMHIREYGYERAKELATLTIPVYNGDPPKFMEYEFTGAMPLDDGRMVQGVMVARAFIEPDPDSLLTLVTPGNNIKPKKPRPHARISVRKLLDIAEEHDPNDPYMIAAIANIKEERGEHGLSGSFKLDTEVESTLFAAIAPSELCKEIENRANDIVRPSAEKPVLFDEERHQLPVEDVVTDPVLPSFTQWVASLFGRFRKKEDREARLLFHRLQPNSSIILHLDKALYLPHRNGGEGTVTGLRLCSSDPRAPELIARISFLNVSVVAPVASDQEEPHKKSVELRIIKEGEKIPFWGDVQDKCIRIDLFDKYSETENHFLATAQIPLRSVFLNGKIVGSLVMKGAPFYMSHEPIDQSPRLSLSVSMRPQLSVDTYPLPSPVGETDILNERAHELWNTLREKNSKRRYVFLLMTALEESYLPCRLIRKQTLDGLEGNLPLLAFVSLIPSIPDTDIADRPGYIVGSSQSVLDSSLGSYIEHAVLLCNILLGRGENVYVVLGSDISTGHCAYVLRRTPIGPPPQSKKEKQKYSNLLIDPISGNIFEVSDPHCAIHDIGTIFNDKNIWYNVQELGRPDQIDWDFENEKSKNWVRFWTEKGDIPEGVCFQPADLVVEDYVEEHKAEIQDLVERMTEESVESLRSPQDTRWHRELDKELACLLMQRKKLTSPEKYERTEFETLLNKVRRHHKSFRIEGSPFFIGYVYDDNNLDDLREHINEEIKKRELYIGMEGAQLARAVVITPYPNDIFAIWILVVVANPKGGKKAGDDSSSFSLEMVQEEKPKTPKQSTRDAKTRSSKQEPPKRGRSPKREKSPPPSAKRRSRKPGDKSKEETPNKKRDSNLLVFSSSSSEDEDVPQKPKSPPVKKGSEERKEKKEPQERKVDSEEKSAPAEPEKKPEPAPKEEKKAKDTKKEIESDHKEDKKPKETKKDPEPKEDKKETKKESDSDHKEEDAKPKETKKEPESDHKEDKKPKETKKEPESDHKKHSSESEHEPVSPIRDRVLLLGEDAATDDGGSPAPKEASKKKAEKHEEETPKSQPKEDSETPPPKKAPEELTPVPPSRTKDDRKFRPVPPAKLTSSPQTKDDDEKDEHKAKPRTIKVSSPHAKEDEPQKMSSSSDKPNAPSDSPKEGGGKLEENVEHIRIELKVTEPSSHSDKSSGEEKHIKLQMKEESGEGVRRPQIVIVDTKSSSEHGDDRKSDGDIPLSPESDVASEKQEDVKEQQKSGSSVKPDDNGNESSSSQRVPVVVTPPLSDSEQEDSSSSGGFQPRPPAVNKPRLARRPTASNSEAQESDVVVKAKPQKKKAPSHVRDLQSRRRTRRTSSPEKQGQEVSDDSDDDTPVTKTIKMDRDELKSRRRGRRRDSDSES